MISADVIVVTDPIHVLIVIDQFGSKWSIIQSVIQVVRGN